MSGSYLPVVLKPRSIWYFSAQIKFDVANPQTQRIGNIYFHLGGVTIFVVFWVQKSQPFDLAGIDFSTSKVPCHNTTTQHNHYHTTTSQNELLLPYHQQLCPLSPRLDQLHPQLTVPWLLKYPRKASGTRFALYTVCSPVWGTVQRHIKN